MIDAAVLLPLLLAPGVVFTVTFRTNRYGWRLPDLHVLALSLIFGLPAHAILLPWTALVVEGFEDKGWKGVLDPATAVWALYLVFAVPVVLAVLLSRATEWSWLRGGMAIAGWTEEARTRSAWDWAFLSGEPAWILITFRDGSLLGGRYGIGALAVLEPEARDLYLLEPHAVEDSGEWTRTGASAMWVSGEEIALIEFFKGKD